MNARIKDGALDEFRALMAEMVATTEANEPGTLIYEWFISDDGTRCYIYERYADSAVAMAHINWFGTMATKFSAFANTESFTACGSLPDEISKAFSGLGAPIMPIVPVSR